MDYVVGLLRLIRHVDFAVAFPGDAERSGQKRRGRDENRGNVERGVLRSNHFFICGIDHQQIADVLLRDTLADLARGVSHWRQLGRSGKSSTIERHVRGIRNLPETRSGHLAADNQISSVGEASTLRLLQAAATGIYRFHLGSEVIWVEPDDGVVRWVAGIQKIRATCIHIVRTNHEAFIRGATGRNQCRNGSRGWVHTENQTAAGGDIDHLRYRRYRRSLSPRASCQKQAGEKHESRDAGEAVFPTYEFLCVLHGSSFQGDRSLWEKNSCARACARA